MVLTAAHIDQHRVVIHALTRQDIPIVESGRVSFQMPFSNHRRLVSNGFQILGDILVLWIDPVVESLDAFHVAVLAREDSRSTGSADRVGAKTVVEPHSPF